MDEIEMCGDGMPIIEHEEVAFSIHFKQIDECHPLHRWIYWYMQSDPIDSLFGKFFNANVKWVFVVWG